MSFCGCPQGYLPPTKNGVEPKRPSRPINITSLVRLSTTVPNTIVVSWTSEIGRVMKVKSGWNCFLIGLKLKHHCHVAQNAFLKAVLSIQSYSMAVYLVRQQSSTVLLQRLRSKGIRNPDHSRALSKFTLNTDGWIRVMHNKLPSHMQIKSNKTATIKITS